MNSYLILILIFLVPLASASEKRSVSTQGQAIKEIYPDRLQMNFQIEIIEDTAEASKQKASNLYNKIKKQLEAMSLNDKEIKTTHFITQPHRPWENNKQVLRGHQTSIGLALTSSSMDKMGELVNVGEKEKNLSITGPNPYISRALYEATYQDCLTIALANAREKAQKMLKSIDEKVGPVLKIIEQGGHNYQPMPAHHRGQEMMMMKGAAADSAPQMEVGKQEVSTMIQVDFEIK
ncbi:MAG: SIMPL domain-containing protein [Bacteriovoracaceae bacterium]|nr:SIMPL domain-containing protein [Bacteriovoracaceae bacterium]